METEINPSAPSQRNFAPTTKLDIVNLDTAATWITTYLRPVAAVVGNLERKAREARARAKIRLPSPQLPVQAATLAKSATEAVEKGEKVAAAVRPKVRTVVHLAAAAEVAEAAVADRTAEVAGHQGKAAVRETARVC